ncbi:MAG: PRC-barrel domain-containing protein [Rhodobacteraceae bacterium]|uniref:PRC-barrel domain-containing protein n=1 Tax=Marivita sp. TaxID=2003365 RepID=UPI003B52FD32|nr:PRC-barrel domain-containing protein [Paracoccaceae bacterium]
MRPFNIAKTATSAFALVLAVPAAAQDNEEVEVLANWSYTSLYSDGWSVENVFAMTEAVGANGNEIGDVENVIFSNDGQVLGIIAEVGGFWDILDTHVFVPWDEVTRERGIEQMRIPVTEETVDDYDVFGGYSLDEQTINSADTNSTQQVDDDLAAGSNIFKATDLIGDYAYLSDGARYGYIADLIVQDGEISSIVTDAAAYGRSGYYAYPYAYRGDMNNGYRLPYDPVEIDTLETFDYERLQSRGNP